MSEIRIRRTYAEEQSARLGWTEPLHGPLPPSSEIEEPVSGDYPFIRRWCAQTGEPMPDFAERLRLAELESEAWFIGRDRLPDPEEEWLEDEARANAERIAEEEYDMRRWFR